ncbi:transcription factor BYE1 [Colletotrichum spaethianum]|uniref:Transcription factor BYE1 n=1 Tax=Colletotrichum spaethianum TaxID=700344 RepID=A0AA37UKA0_9PEZI|nr:transcription factor BYE1 [Colletotrichum spaethianum]GKT49711.1 transcription factor BYE1 [Colletotrichum spaethianum]
MDFSVSGAITVQQSGLPGTATIFESPPNSFANSTDAKILQQHEQQQQQQRTRFLFQQQQQRMQQPIGSGRNALHSAFVAPSALSSAPEAPLLVPDRHSSTSTQSSSGWQDSPVSNDAESLSSPTSSIISPPTTTNLPSAPPIDPLILSSVKDDQIPPSEEAPEPPKRRRGRPRLSEGAPKTTRATAPTTTNLQRKSTSRRTSTASASGADELMNDHGGTTNDKKNRIRARNREAAYKCRQKKQKGIEELQTQEAMVENINKSLNNEAAQLRGEILMLKNMVLQHGGCGCAYIEEYISGAAQSLVQSSMAAASGPGGHGMQMHSQNCTNVAGGDGYVDWKMFNMGPQADMPSLESESGFSGFEEAASHSARAQSQGASMV